ncbi:MAG TPA: hypothetical protein VFS00_18575, partial [Polyangiaceae bacterium]|nr:hypothetical protein [Polyangiaceae bacterium]
MAHLTFAERLTLLALTFATAPAAAQTAAPAPPATATSSAPLASPAPAGSSAASAPPTAPSRPASAPAASAAGPAATIGRAVERAGNDEAVRVVELPWEWLTAAPLPAPGEATVSMRPIRPGTFSWAAPAAGTGSA